MKKKQKQKIQDTLYLFYDLSIATVTFDLCYALAYAEKYRKQQGYQAIHVVFVPGKNLGVRKEVPEYEAIINNEARHWRRYYLLLPLTHLLPSCSGVSFCSTREEAEEIRKSNINHLYPLYYTIDAPYPSPGLSMVAIQNPDIQCFKAGEQACRYVQQWLSQHANNRKTIVITLRQYGYCPDRNSNIEAWAAFAKSLDPNQYFVIFIPDTEVAMDLPDLRLNAFTHFLPACWNLEIRTALYEAAYLHLGINNGPLSICWLNPHCHYMMFKVTTESVIQTSSHYLEMCQFKVQQQPPFLLPHQRWIWKDDNFEIIQEEFEKMCCFLEKNPMFSKMRENACGFVNV